MAAAQTAVTTCSAARLRVCIYAGSWLLAAAWPRITASVCSVANMHDVVPANVIVIVIVERCTFPIENTPAVVQKAPAVRVVAHTTGMALRQSVAVAKWYVSSFPANLASRRQSPC